MLRYVKKNEEYIYVALWAVVFVTPLIVMAYHSKDASTMPPAFGWESVLLTWRFSAIFLFVFIVHNILVAPQLVYGGRRVAYLLQLILLVVGFLCLQNLVRPPRPDRAAMEQAMRRSAPGPREAQGGDAPFAASPAGGPQRGEHRPKAERRPRGEQFRPHRMPEPMFIFRRGETVMTIVLLLLLLLNIGVKYYFKSEEERKRISELEKKNLEQQLEYLKFQINPHFFMNTLNNIHALVDIDPEQAKYTVLVLSKMMRYVLYDGEREMIPLKKEIDFILNYVELMRIRYTQQVEISVSIDHDLPDGEMPPLLLITFVENAFKHGVSMQHPSFIRLKCSVNEDTGLLTMDCANSKHPALHPVEKKQGGVGLTNALRRLDLIYGDNYDLRVTDSDETYEVHLELPINPPTLLSEEEG